MLLINIEKLSDSELRYIAEQEGLEDFDSMDRQDLVDALLDIEDDWVPTERVGGLGAKYSKTITSIEDTRDISLPGVNPVPENYNENSIHLIFRDSDWAFVVWNITYGIRTKLDEREDCRVVLRAHRVEKGNSFDIDVDKEDSDWLFELPAPNEGYFVELVLVEGDGETVLATSNTIRTSNVWLETHYAELSEDEKELMFRPLVSREGRLTSNKLVKRIFDLAGGSL